MKLSDFSKGDRVRFIDGRIKGQTGVVIRPVKSRNVVTVELDEKEYMSVEWWDAKPEYLEKVTS